MKAHLRNTRISPKKANIVAGLVRGEKVEKALKFLKFTPKKAAKLLYKVIASASANAENNFKQNKDDLIVKSVIVTQGPTYKRGRAVSRGRWHQIKKRTSHITINLEVTGEQKVKSEKKKIEDPREVTPEEAQKEIKKAEKESQKGPEAKEPRLRDSEKNIKGERTEGEVNNPTPAKDKI